MVTVKCKHCGVAGFKFCTHGKYSKKKYINHHKDCRMLKVKKFNFNRKRKFNK